MVARTDVDVEPELELVVVDDVVVAGTAHSGGTASMDPGSADSAGGTNALDLVVPRNYSAD